MAAPAGRSMPSMVTDPRSGQTGMVVRPAGTATDASVTADVGATDSSGTVSATAVIPKRGVKTSVKAPTTDGTTDPALLSTAGTDATAVGGWRPANPKGTYAGPVPEAPSLLTATAAGDGLTVDLAWSSSATDARGATIERQTLVGSTWTNSTQKTAGPTSKTLRDEPGQGTFRYRVSLQNEYGTSSATTWTQVEVRPPAGPDAPSNLTIQGPLASLHWKDNSNNEQYFEVRREQNTGGVWGGLETFSLPQNLNFYTESPGAGTFRYQLRAVNQAGTSAYTPWVSTTIVEYVPQAPTALRVSEMGANGLQPLINWQDNSLNESGFRLVREKQLAGGSWGEQVVEELLDNTNGYVDVPGTGVFRYKVSSFSNAGESAYTPWLNVTVGAVLPAAPTGLIGADAGNGAQVNLNWTDQAANESGFNIERQTKSGSNWVSPVTFNAGVDAAAYTDAPGVGTFRYRVRSFNSVGASSWTAWVTPTVSQVAPAAPSGLAMTDLGDGNRVKAAWADNSSNEAGFEIVREKLQGSSWVSPTTLTAIMNATTINDTPGVGTFRYKIRAVNAIGPSAYNGPVSVTVVAVPPTAPTGLTAADAGDASRANLAWSDTSNNETGFEIGREQQSGTSWINPVTRSVAANIVSYSDVAGVGTFRYRVRSVGAGGASAYTGWTTVSINGLPPTAPSGLTTSDQGNGSGVVLSWVDNANNETANELFREKQSGTTWGSGVTITLAPNLVAYTDNPGPGTWRYKARSVNGFGASGWTNPSQITIVAQPPAAPTGLVVTDAGNRRALASWTDNSAGVASFELERQPAFAISPVQIPAGTTGYVDQSGPGNFSYRVRAKSVSGTSAFTGWVAVTISDTLPTAPDSAGATDQGGGSVKFTWADKSDNETGFKVQRETQSGASWVSQTNLTAAANATSLTDSPGLGTYRYRVASTNTVGDSAYTTWVVVTLGASSGWTALNPSPDSRVVYVSSSSGSDSNNGLSEAAPKRTIAAGYSQLRNGYPDYLLLKRGDVWNETLGNWGKSGRSATEPMVVMAYGTTGDRPLLNTGNAEGMTTPTLDLKFLAFVSLHLSAHTRTPSSSGTPVGMNFVCTGGTWLFEDMFFERYANNLIIQGWPGRVSGVKIRRSIFYNPIRADAGNTQMYLDNVDGIFMEESYMINTKSNDSLTATNGTKMSHGAYLHESCGPVTVIGSVAYNNRTNFSIRTGGTVKHNLSIRGGQAFQIGYGDMTPATVFGNVITESRNHWDGQPLGQGIVISGSNGVNATYNLTANSTDGGDHYTFWLDPNNATVNINHNVSYNWRQSVWEAPLIMFNGASPGPITVSANDYQQTGGKYCVQFLSAVGSWVKFNNNRYYTTNSQYVTASNRSYTFAEWKSLVEPTAVQQQVAYTDPARTIGKYNTTLGGTNDTEAWLAGCLQQSKWNWRPAYTARGYNDYIRAGFNMNLPADP